MVFLLMYIIFVIGYFGFNYYILRKELKRFRNINNIVLTGQDALNLQNEMKNIKLISEEEKQQILEDYKYIKSIQDET